jgi:AGZA family xanthine/uracil permease-like MFS transporter
VALAFFPPIAYLLAIKLGNPGIVPAERFAELFSAPGHGLPELAVIVMLGNGFIITSMLWATALAAMIDHRPRAAAGALAVGALFAAFGVIHSVRPDGGLMVPWQLDGAALAMAAQFTGAYLGLAAMLWLLSLQRGAGGKS